MLKKPVLAVVILLLATNVWAVKSWKVSAGAHNMAMGGGQPYASNNEDEVCIFCHTPHGGSLNGPLWNRNLPNQAGANAFSHYTSPTLSPYMRVTLSPTRPVRNESLLCMSCHDGQVAYNSILNPSNRTGGLPTFAGDQDMEDYTFGGASSVIGDPNATGSQTFLPGRNLTNDHPISFAYTNAVNDAANTGKLHTDAYARGIGIRFFGNQTTENYVECSSCHDPHVNYSLSGDGAYAPFLVAPNSGSALCLACHIK
jgi:hypothetical protein